MIHLTSLYIINVGINMDISEKLNELISTKDKLSLLEQRQDALKSIMDGIVLMDGIDDTLIDCKSYAYISKLTYNVECRTLVMINGKEVAIENEISEYELSSGLLSENTVRKIKSDISDRIANMVFGSSLTAMNRELQLAKKHKFHADAIAKRNSIAKP